MAKSNKELWLEKYPFGYYNTENDKGTGAEVIDSSRPTFDDYDDDSSDFDIDWDEYERSLDIDSDMSDEEADYYHSNLYGGDRTYCPDCGNKLTYGEDGYSYCPDCNSRAENDWGRKVEDYEEDRDEDLVALDEAYLKESREVTTLVLDMIEDGMVSAEDVARMCLSYLSEEDAEDIANTLLDGEVDTYGDVRQYTNALIDLCEEGSLGWDTLVNECLQYMSEDDVSDMAHSNELIDDDEEERESVDTAELADNFKDFLIENGYREDCVTVNNKWDGWDIVTCKDDGYGEITVEFVEDDGDFEIYISDSFLFATDYDDLVDVFKEDVIPYIEYEDGEGDLEEGWARFEYASGANPYIAKTEKEKKRICNKYGKNCVFKGNVNGNDHYVINDKTEDAFINDDLDESLSNLKDLVASNGHKLVKYDQCVNGRTYKSVFDYSSDNGGTLDGFKYYNDYVVDVTESNSKSTNESIKSPSAVNNALNKFRREAHPTTDLGTMKRNAIKAAERDGYNQLIVKDDDGSYSIVREYPGSTDNRKVVGKATVSYKGGVAQVDYKELKESILSNDGYVTPSEGAVEQFLNKYGFGDDRYQKDIYTDNASKGKEIIASFVDGINSADYRRISERAKEFFGQCPVEVRLGKEHKDGEDLWATLVFDFGKCSDSDHSDGSLNEGVSKRFKEVATIEDTEVNNKEFIRAVEDALGPDELYGGPILEIKDFSLVHFIQTYSNGVSVNTGCKFKALVDGDFDRDNDHAEWIEFDLSNYNNTTYNCWWEKDEDGGYPEGEFGTYTRDVSSYIIDAFMTIDGENIYCISTYAESALEKYVPEPEDETFDESLNETLEGRYCIVARTNDGKFKFYKDGAFVDNYKEATIFTDMDEARSEWFDIDKSKYKRVFIPNYDESHFSSLNEDWEEAFYYDVRQLPVGTKVRVTGTDWNGEDFTIEAFVLGAGDDSNSVRITRDESSRFDADSRYYEEVDADWITDVFYEESVFMGELNENKEDDLYNYKTRQATGSWDRDDNDYLLNQSEDDYIYTAYDRYNEPMESFRTEKEAMAYVDAQEDFDRVAKITKQVGKREIIIYQEDDGESERFDESTGPHFIDKRKRSAIYGEDDYGYDEYDVRDVNPLPHIKLKRGNRHITLNDTSKVGEEGHPIQRGLDGRLTESKQLKESAIDPALIDVDKVSVEYDSEYGDDTFRRGYAWVYDQKEHVIATIKAIYYTDICQPGGYRITVTTDNAELNRLLSVDNGARLDVVDRSTDELDMCSDVYEDFKDRLREWQKNHSTTTNEKLSESKQLNEGPGAGYKLSGKLKVTKVESLTPVKFEDADYGSYDVTFNCVALGTIEDFEFYSYMYGDKMDSAEVEISAIKTNFYAEHIDDIEALVRNNLEEVKDCLVGATVHLEYVYGAGWLHSKFDGTIAEINDLVKDSDIVYGDTFDIEVFEFDAKIKDTDVIEYVDKAVSGENFSYMYTVIDEDGNPGDAFFEKDDAIEYAKKNHCQAVDKTECKELFGGDTEWLDSEIVWENDEDFE